MNEQLTWSNYKEGSEADYALLYRHYAPILFRYGCKITSDREAVKDCLQQVFLTLWNKRETITTPTSVKSYLFKMMRSEIFRTFRTEKNVTTLSTEYHFKVETSYESEIIEGETENDYKRKIANVLSKLPDRQREVVFLKYYNNLSYAEIADIMGIEQESVYKLTYKAIEKLQRLFLKVSAGFLLLLSLFE